MFSISQLFELMIITLCFDFGKSFQPDYLGSDQQLPDQLRLLVAESKFSDDELLLTSCEKQYLDNVFLDLSNLKMEQLPLKVYSNKNLTCLDLQANDLQENVVFNVFGNLTNLEYLNLARNNLNLQKLLEFNSHPNIKTLILDHVFSYIDYFFLKKYEDLKVLRLDLPNLEKLSLRKLNPHRCNVYDDISWLDLTSTKLTHLFLSQNNFFQINHQFFKRFPTTLTHLFLENCKLYSYLAPVNQTASLISLSMDYNLFSNSNGDYLNFEGHPELKRLSLANCDISEISPNIFNTNSKLVYLDLSGNKIQQFSERTFQKTPALKSLILNDNQLSKIPNLQSLANLNKLYLKGNKLINLDKDSFSNFKNLKILSLSNNNIDYIDSSDFDSLLNLVLLDLSSNEISNLDYRTSFNLEYLILTNNLISSVDDIKLDNRKLKYLVLINNSLMILKPASFTLLSENTTIILQSPPTLS